MKLSVIILFSLIAVCQLTAGDAKRSTVTPAINPSPDRSKEYKWLERHQQVLDEIKKKPVDMIFIGDSITHYFGGPPKARYIRGGKTWQKYYGHRNAVNMGFGWDRTQHMLWRLDHGEIDGISPKVAVVMAGTNNVLWGDGSADDIFEGVKAIIKRIQTKSPKTKILLVGVLPFSKNPKDKRRNKIKAVNAKLAGLADNKQLFFIDVGHLFLKQDDSVSKELMGDYLHPNSNGYAVYAKAIEPMVAKLFGDKAVK